MEDDYTRDAELPNAFDEILERGRKLQQQMKQSVKTQYDKDEDELMRDNPWQTLHGNANPKLYSGIEQPPQDYLHGIDFEVNEHDSVDIDSLKAKTNMLMKQRETGTILEHGTTMEKQIPQEKPNEQAQLFMPLKEIDTIQIRIEGISVKSDFLKHKISEDNLYIQAKIPLVSEITPNAFYDTLKIKCNGISENNTIFQIKNTSQHNIKITDDNFQSFLNSSFQIELISIGEDGDSANKLGFGKLSLQRLLLMKGFKLDTLLKIHYEVQVPQQDGSISSKKAAVTSKKGKKSKQKPKNSNSKSKTHEFPSPKEKLAKSSLRKIDPKTDVADLRIIMQLLNSTNPLSFEQSQSAAPLPRTTASQSLAGLNTLNESNDRNAFILSVKIGRAKDVILRKYEGDDQNIFRNLSVAYKSFPSGDKVQTNVVFSSNSPVLNHSMQFPLFLNQHTFNKIQNLPIVFEVWDKIAPNKDQLVGIAKISLQNFYHALVNAKSMVNKNVF